LREDFFSAPSSDGIPFQVWIRYAKQNVSGDKYFYAGEKTPNYDPVVVAYNLFSLRADEVTYDAKSRTIAAMSALPIGTLSITASYGGDGANAKSTSRVLMQVVNQ